LLKPRLPSIVRLSLLALSTFGYRFYQQHFCRFQSFGLSFECLSRNLHDCNDDLATLHFQDTQLRNRLQSGDRGDVFGVSAFKQIRNFQWNDDGSESLPDDKFDWNRIGFASSEVVHSTEQSCSDFQKGRVKDWSDKEEGGFEWWEERVLDAKSNKAEIEREFKERRSWGIDKDREVQQRVLPSSNEQEKTGDRHFIDLKRERDICGQANEHKRGWNEWRWGG
jgi:hypothetical protein